jgi:hypothetical protein
MSTASGVGLGDLPIELVLDIASYLMGPLAKQDYGKKHPILALAATSHSLNDQVEALCEMELRRLGNGGADFSHKFKSWDIVDGRPRKRKPVDTYRMFWLKFGRPCCAWCGKSKCFLH